MRGICCICTELFEPASDISAIQCGHTFHATCLTKWRDQSHTCPHCHEKIKPKFLIDKLYFNTEEDSANEDVSSLKNQLSDLKAQIKTCQKEEANLKSEKKNLQQDILELTTKLRCTEGWLGEIRNLSWTLKAELFQREKLLRLKLADLKNAEKVVKGHEGEIQGIVDKGNIKQLSTWSCILQKELQTKRQDVRSLRENLDRLKKENFSNKQAISEKNVTITNLKDQNDSLNKELQDTDKEVIKLKKKIDLLQQALGSPSDTARSFAHRLINESPAPMLKWKKPHLSSSSSCMDPSLDLFSPELNESRTLPGPSPFTAKTKKECLGVWYQAH